MSFWKLQLSKVLKLLNQSSHSKVMSPSTTWLELVFTNLQKYHLVENLIINTFSKIQLSASCFYSIVYSVGTGRNMYMCCVYIYLWRKVVCLFCFAVMRSTKPEYFRSCSWCLQKAFNDEGCMGSVPWQLDSKVL